MNPIDQDRPIDDSPTDDDAQFDLLAEHKDWSILERVGSALEKGDPVAIDLEILPRCGHRCPPSLTFRSMGDACFGCHPGCHFFTKW